MLCEAFYCATEIRLGWWKRYSVTLFLTFINFLFLEMWLIWIAFKNLSNEFCNLYAWLGYQNVCINNRFKDMVIVLLDIYEGYEYIASTKWLQSWLSRILDGLDQRNAYEHLKGMVNCHKMHLFDVVNRYYAIFTDDTSGSFNCSSIGPVKKTHCVV